MKNLLILSTLSLFLFSCQQKSAGTDGEEKAKIDPKILVSCDGIGDIKLTDTYETLEKKFGKDLSVHENTVVGKFATVWDGKPNQVNIYFEEKAQPFKTIKHIETNAPDAPYMTADSLRIGMTGKEIQKINSDMPITMLNPYGSNEPGLIQSFNNGEIATNNPCLSGHMEVSSQKNIPTPDIQAFQAEPVVESTHKLMGDRMEIVIANFRVSKPKK